MKNYVDSLIEEAKNKKTKGRAEKKTTEKEKPEPKKTERFEIPAEKNEMPEMYPPKSAAPIENPQPAEEHKEGVLNKITDRIKEMKQGIQDAAEKEEENKKSQIEEEMEKTEKVLIDSYANTKIYRVPGEALLYYWTPVVRPGGGEKTIINTIKEAATRIISIAPYKIRDPEERRTVYYQKILEIIRNSPELSIQSTKMEFYADAVVREMIGYGIIDFLLKDDRLEEIMIIGPNAPVYIFHRQYEMMITNIEFNSDKEIQDLINRIARQVGRRVDIASPLLDARLPDGSRVNATLPPATVEGSTLTIRKFREDPYTIVDLIKKGTLGVDAAAFLWVCVEGLGVRPGNILISGGTGSGKTTLLNVLASFIPKSERVISIEDTAELNLPIKHWIRMEARPPGLEGTGELTMDILTKNSLRMRPDRVIVGEIRHEEAFALFTAFNTGHDGSLGTVHANSPEETIIRVTSPPMNVPKVMMSGLNFVIVQHRIHDKKMGTIRRVTEIAEVTGALAEKPTTKTIYKWDPYTDTLKRTDQAIEYLILLQDMTGTSKKKIEEVIQERAKFLTELVKEKKINMLKTSDKMSEYLEKSESA